MTTDINIIESENNSTSDSQHGVENKNSSTIVKINEMLYCLQNNQ